MSWWGDMVKALTGRGPRMVGRATGRVAGPPRSANGASSFHLMWDLPGSPARRRVVEVAATLEILAPPQTDDLYFWALQVDLADARGIWGGAHTGLQWNRRYPDGRAVNWGGYHSGERGGGVLSGSVSDLQGFADDPHTLAYAWEVGRPYRLRVFASPDVPGAWRAAVTDLLADETVVIRDLFPPPGRGGEPGYLARPLVWSEVFADCDAPSVAVRWSDLTAVDASRTVLSPEAVSVNYQSEAAGGCANTTVALDDVGLRQVTSVERTTPQGARLAVPRGLSL